MLNIICLISFNLFAQDDDYYGDNLNSNLYTAFEEMVSTAVQSPDVMAFKKSTFVPVSNYTGRANISIPILV